MGFGAGKGFSEPKATSLIEALSNRNRFVFEDFTNFAESLVGTGNTIRDVSKMEAASGGTKDSLAVAYHEVNLGSGTDDLNFTVDWDLNLDVLFFGIWATEGIATSRYSWMRFADDLTGGDLAEAGVGFRFDRNGYKLYGQSHDGADLESTLISTADLFSTIHRFHIRHNAGVSVQFYIDDVLKATHTTYIPSGEQSNSGRLSIGVENPNVDEHISVVINRAIVAQDWA